MKYYLFVVICILFNVLLALTYKKAAQRRCSPQAALLIAYTVAAVSAVGNLIRDWPMSFQMNGFTIGCASGFLVFGAGFTFFGAVKYGRLALSWTIRALALAIPIAASLIFWHEAFTARKALGFCAMLGCILLVGSGNRRMQEKS